MGLTPLEDLLELYELDHVSASSFDCHIITVESHHVSKVFITNTNDNDADWKIILRNMSNLGNSLFHVIDFTVRKNHQNVVHHRIIELCNVLACFLNDWSKVSGAKEHSFLDNLSVHLKYVVNPMKFSLISLVKIEISVHSRFIVWCTAKAIEGVFLVRVVV